MVPWMGRIVDRCLTMHLASALIDMRMDYEATLDRAMEDLPEFSGLRRAA